MKEQGFPMISPGLEHLGLKTADAGLKVLSGIPQVFFEVAIAYLLVRWGVSKIRGKKPQAS